MTTKRRQLPADFCHPSDLTHVLELAETAAEYEFYGDRDRYIVCIQDANTRLNRSERCFLAGFLAARRSEQP